LAAKFVRRRHRAAALFLQVPICMLCLAMICSAESVTTRVMSPIDRDASKGTRVVDLTPNNPDH